MKLRILLAFAITAIAFGQPRPSFEVASIRPSAPLDTAKMMAAIQKGEKLPFGATVTATHAEYLGMDLKTLLTYAYGVKPYQITGPDWMPSTRFDIEAKMPD